MDEGVGKKQRLCPPPKKKKRMGERSKEKSLELEEDLDRVATSQKVCPLVSLIEITSFCPVN